MTLDDITGETLLGATHVDAANGGTAVDTSLSLTDLNNLLGKDFKDIESARKAVKDTFAFVGKRKEDIAAELRSATSVTDTSANADVMKEIQAVKDKLFYAEHPQYKGYEAAISAMGSNPAEVVGLPAFQGIYEKAKMADEVAQTRSVAPSNARLAQTKSAVDEAISVANARGATAEDVATVLARSIIAETQDES